MNKEEAERVIRILITCDGGCEYCVSSLLKIFCEEFPEYAPIAEKAFKETFNKEFHEVIE